MKNIFPIKIILLISLLIGIVSGCNGEYSEQSTGDTDESYIEEDHLLNSELLEMINMAHYFDGFMLSEAVYDGQLVYQLQHAELELKILIDRQQENATVIYCGKETVIPIWCTLPYSSNNYCTFSLNDFTVDGVPELVMIETGGGVGTKGFTCHIVDLSQMCEIPIDTSVRSWLEQISVIPKALYQEDELPELICSISGFGMGPSDGSIPVRVVVPLQEYEYSVSDSTGYMDLTFNQENKSLILTAAFTLGNAQDGCYLGEVFGELKYEPETHSFRVSPQAELRLNSPCEY